MTVKDLMKILKKDHGMFPSSLIFKDLYINSRDNRTELAGRICSVEEIDDIDFEVDKLSIVCEESISYYNVIVILSARDEYKLKRYLIDKNIAKLNKEKQALEDFYKNREEFTSTVVPSEMFKSRSRGVLE